MASISAARSRDLAFDYLKATLVLMFVAHHSCLAYTTFPHFDPAHPLGLPCTSGATILSAGY